MESSSVNPYSVIADLIAYHFGYEELNNDLCYPCGVDFEALAGNEKKSKAREIVEFFRRRDTIESHLLPTLEQERPNRVIETSNNVLLIGIDYRFLKRGNAAGYYLDSFTLKANEGKTLLEGVKIDQREIEVPVVFEKSQRQKK